MYTSKYIIYIFHGGVISLLLSSSGLHLDNVHVHEPGNEGRHRHFAHIPMAQLAVISVAKRVHLTD